jgi:hypothetical protein
MKTIFITVIDCSLKRYMERMINGVSLNPCDEIILPQNFYSHVEGSWHGAWIQRPINNQQYGIYTYSPEDE